MTSPSRVTLFLLVLVLAAVAIISSVGTFLPHQMMMSGMLSGMASMMGERYSVMTNFFWPSLLTASATIIVVAIAYVVVFPTINYSNGNGSRQDEKQLNPPMTSSLDPMDIVIRVAKPDERAALEVLRNSGGICLQKDITYKTGLSKLKTHRIVARLAERGVVEVRKLGKNNEIRVPAWLKRSGELAHQASKAA